MRRLLATSTLFFLLASSARAAGFPIMESAEDLGLKYELSAEISGDDDIVLVSLTIADLGKLKPLDVLTLEIPDAAVSGRQTGGLNVFPLALKEKDGKLTAWAQINRRLAEKAELHFVPQKPPDGHVVYGWVFYSVPLRDRITVKSRTQSDDRKDK